MPRNPKKKSSSGSGGKKKPSSPSSPAAAAAKKAIAAQQQQQSQQPQQPRVWLPGTELDPEIDGDAADVELEYDPTAYDCLHRFQAEWPCLSLDLPRDALGGPRSAFPHELFVVAGTQADQPRNNCLAVLRLTHLGQGRHGKRDAGGKRAARRRDAGNGGEAGAAAARGGAGAKKAAAAHQGGGNDDAMSEGGDDEEDDDDEDNDDEGFEDDDEDEDDDQDDDEPPRMHARLVSQPHGTNRVRCAPQRPGLVAVWADTGSVRVMDVSGLMQEMAQDEHPKPKSASRVQNLNPVQTHKHSDEGFALDWSPAHEGRLASGDCARHIHVWDPSSAGLSWAVSSPYCGHAGSVEDVQWSPAEPTVFASASADGSVRVWDCRAAPKKGSMLCRPQAHSSDVNVLSWNRLVGYMLASGGDDGALRVWDLRTFSGSGGGGGDASAPVPAAPNSNATTAAEPVAHFAFHRAPVTSVEWSPYEGSMLATAGADDQVAVWDLALERDPEEEAAAAAAAGAGAAAPPPDLPPQLMFVHAGQKDIKELRWHPQIPGMLVTTAADGFNAFRPSNL